MSARAAGLLAPLIGDPQTDRALSDEAQLEAMCAFELALAEAQAQLGVIPASCVEPIRRAARSPALDLEALARDAAHCGNLAIPLVRQLTARVAEGDPDAARYVHWGATSQDVLDSALVLQLRRALPPIEASLERASARCAELAERHASTPLPGRTWLQQATPISFGLKAAGWLDALGRCGDELRRASAQVAVLQLGGASGALSALGERGPELARATAERLGLAAPPLPWHAQRDRLVRLACALGVAVGALGKIARDLALLAQSEVAEAWEVGAAGRGGSSAMPHKRNPVSASVVLAAAARAPGLVATLLAAMGQEHERGLGGWQAEWVALPDLVRTSAGAARALADALERLELDPARMRENLECGGGLVYAEAVAMALAESLGKSAAHARVEAACRRAREQGRALLEVLAEDEELRAKLGRDELAALFQPERALGAVPQWVAQALAHARLGSSHGRE